MSRFRLIRGGPVGSLGTIALSVAWAFAGFRNLPRLSHPQGAAAAVIVAVCILVAYRAGRKAVTASAVAAAVAQAEATAVAAAQSRSDSQATANVIVVNNPQRGARAAGVAAGLDDMPWMIGSHRAVELDETEALDVALEDVLDAREAEEA